MAERLMKPRILATNGPGFSLFLYLLLAVTIAITTASCGLGNVTYLYPPEEFRASSTQLIINHDIRNYDPGETPQTFLGYEIFYRAFDSLESANSFALNIQNLDAEELISRGMLRMICVDSSSQSLLPAIPVSDADKEHSYYIDFSANLTNWQIYEKNLTGVSSLVGTAFRNIPSADYFSFRDKTAYSSGDSDYSGTTTSPADIWFVFCAFAYGQDSSVLFDSIYSEQPVTGFLIVAQ